MPQKIEPQMQELLKDPTIKKWLNEFINPKTQTTYQITIYKFFKDTQLTPTQLQTLPTNEIKSLLIIYQTQQKELYKKYKTLTPTEQKEHKKKKQPKGLSDNAILSVLTAVRSYLVSIDKHIKFRRGQLLKTQEDIHSHIFTNGDLKSLWDIGGSFEKALLATAVSEGWEISAFLDQSKSKMQARLAHAAQNNEKYIFFRDIREKTGEKRLCIINPLAIECLTKYFASAESQQQDPADDRLFPITQDGVQKMFYRLAQDANLQTTGTLRFHNIRKWLMSRLSKCSFNDFQIKYIMGKAIPVSDSTYLQTLQSEVEEKYPIVYNDYLCIVPSFGGTAKQHFDDLKKQITAFQTVNTSLTERLTATEKEFTDFKKTIGDAVESLQRYHPILLRLYESELKKQTDNS